MEFVKYIIMFVLSIGFFCQTYTSHFKILPVVNSSDLKPADKKRIALETFTAHSFKLNRSKVETTQGRREELGRLIQESGFKGHVNVARQVFCNYLSSCGLEIIEPVKNNPASEQSQLLLPLVSQQEQAADDVMKKFLEFHDTHGYPTDVYFCRLIRYIDHKKDPELDWYLKHS